ncbi:hypothetical protein V7O62_01525 [Methanolobus sp. ZRKC2]|uniref:hypothetical protein n=1 Tax=Methanolobus sp. ZRKC2 TaxID=3125783 RepID=UPI003244A400
MTNRNPTSFRLSPVDRCDLQLLVDQGIFTNMSDAGRGALRKGIEAIKEERGI